MSEFLDQSTPSSAPSGFDFSLSHRNASLSSSSKSSINMVAKKTGTTIVGTVFDGGVVLGADTRATAGSEVADKFCEKIHYLAPNIYCCGGERERERERGRKQDRSGTEELLPCGPAIK